MMNLPKLLLSFIFLTFLKTSTFSQSPTSFKFDFGGGKVAKGYTQVLPSMRFEKERGFGFSGDSTLYSVERKDKNALHSDFITSNKPFFFSVALPEGNYNVTVITGDKEGTSQTTVRAECRRLMLQNVETAKGKIQQSTFTVNIRNAQINEQEKVKLKPRELNYWHWDKLLTLEFNNTMPKICAVEITKVEDATTIFLAGNSTVVDQSEEPWAAWGQIFPIFFKTGKIAIANHAESGESLRSFLTEKRLDKIKSQIKKGDYLFIEFAHNDQKQKDLLPFVGYKELLKKFIAEARAKEAIPVLVTSMHRRSFDENGKIINTLGDFPAAMRQTAQEENVALIDLNAMSKILYETWGAQKAIKAFVHYPANSFPGQDKEIKDDTHFSTYGAWQIAKCIVEGLKANKLEIVKQLKDDLPTFDPSKPDDIATWMWPLSPLSPMVKPDGN